MGKRRINELGNFLRNLRREYDETQAMMAIKLKTNNSYLSTIENGHRIPSNKFLIMLILQYRLSYEQQRELFTAIRKTQQGIDLTQFSPTRQELMKLLIKRWECLNDRQLLRLKQILNEKN